MDISVYEHALSVWSKADLTNLQKELDGNVLEVKDKESTSLESRKTLATETKKFKKLESNEKLDQINKIIKHYQQEIDSLTKRAKFAEKSLFDVYAKISEAPDPTSLLQNSVNRLSKTDDSDELKSKIESLEDKLAKYADYESLKKRLLNLEQNSAVALAKRLTVKEEEINSIWEEKQRHWNEKEEDFQKQIKSLQDSKNSSNSNAETDDSNTDHGADSVEFTLLNHELETAQTRVLQLEKRNEELNGSLAKVKGEAANGSELHSKNIKIGHLESENALLSAALEKERNINNKDKIELKEKLEKLESETKTYKSELEVTTRKLNNYSDYNEIKNELSVLKRIEFGTDSDVESSLDEDDDQDGDKSNKARSKADDVNSTLVLANKKLQSSLADLRVVYSDAKEKSIKYENEVKDLTKRLKDLETQNSKLEADLEKVDMFEPKFNDNASMISGVSRHMNNRSGHTGKWSPTSSIIGIPEEEDDNEGSNSTSSGNSTILPIITKQRDRFRSKNTELEKKVREYNNEKVKLKSEISKLKTDNGKLYERVRYLSSYGVTQGGGNRSVENDSTFMNDEDTEAQYSNNYEESLHPLASFRKKELSYYRKERLPILEKLFVSFANIILQNKTTRMVFLFYCIGLHGLVFMMSMYVINISGYLTPEVGIVQSSTSSTKQGVNIANAGI